MPATKSYSMTPARPRTCRSARPPRCSNCAGEPSHARLRDLSADDGGARGVRLQLRFAGDDVHGLLEQSSGCSRSEVAWPWPRRLRSTSVPASRARCRRSRACRCGSPRSSDVGAPGERIARACTAPRRPRSRRARRSSSATATAAAQRLLRIEAAMHRLQPDLLVVQIGTKILHHHRVLAEAHVHGRARCCTRRSSACRSPAHRCAGTPSAARRPAAARHRRTIARRGNSRARSPGAPSAATRAARGELAESSSRAPCPARCCRRGAAARCDLRSAAG